MAYEDISGKTFGSWKVVAKSHSTRGGIVYKCICGCGTERLIFKGNLTSGKTKSCGCLKGSVLSKKKTSHGHSRAVGRKASRVYNSWSSMITRCKNPNAKSFHNYGGRGIAVCDRWFVFENFLADMGEPREGESLDRIDFNGNYEPSNCRWADKKTQTRNRRNTKLTEEDVEMIRSGKISVQEIVGLRNCSKSTYYMAKIGSNWK